MPMATSQMRRSDVTTENWTSIFKSTEQLSEQKSSLFVKKLLAVSISSVTYLRAVFPERCFGDRCLEDLNLKILRDEESFPGSGQVIQWVKGCFDAIERKYLRKIVLGFYLNASDPDTVIETYTFKFDYYSDGINIYRNEEQIASAKTADDTKRATIRLLRTLVVLTQSLKSLPDDVMMTMKLLYFDDVTPPDYQPVGFENIEYTADSFPPDTFRLAVGDISTPFHMVGLRCQSTLHQLEAKVLPNEMNQDESYLDHESDAKSKNKEGMGNNDMTFKDTVDASQDPCALIKPQKPAEDKETNQDMYLENDATPMECREVPSHSPDVPGPKDAATEVYESVSTPLTSAEEQLVPNVDQTSVKCSCGFDGDDGMMILCEVCKNWQHASCYRFVTEDDCPSFHVCVSCAKSKKMKCTDSTLVELNPITLQTTCLWRRALVACRNLARLTAPKFSERLGVELTVAQGLMKKMQQDGFLRQAAKGKRLGKLVSKDKFTIEALKKYFHPSEDTIEMPEPTAQESESRKTKDDNKETLDEQELQRMVDKAAEIDISGKYRARPRNDKVEEVIDQRSRPKLRGRKRVISTIDNDLEFTVSDSQDPMDASDRNPAKKKKVSGAQQAIII